MKNKGRSDYTIKTYDKCLSYLSKHVDLDNAEQVKTFIANKQCSDNYKRNLSVAYDRYCDYYQIVWNKPRYRQTAKMVRIPTTTQIEMLITNAGRVNSVKLTLSKETGLRPIELCRLRVRDIDLQRRIVYPTTAKHGAPRALKISPSLKTMLERHISQHELKPETKLFKGDADNYGKHYRLHRNRLAKKLNKPELKEIKLYDFRHYFATRLYAKTRDILLVKQLMGHKKIETTLIYTQLLHLEQDDEYICKAVQTKEQAMQLIENSFEFHDEIDGYKLYRKRK